MQRFVHIPAGRFLALLLCAALAPALGAQPAAASNRSMFASTQAYVGKSAAHQNLFDDKFTARDFAGARREVRLIARNALAAGAALAKQKPSNARGARGKQALLRYWKLKRAATAELDLFVEATAWGDTPTAKRYLARYEQAADKAVGQLYVGIPYLT